ncbi:MAG: hypothetical protein HC842_01685 [Cytophagales bacterium]|nr:hypothetical protein [Cytophagales bacterium]
MLSLPLSHFDLSMNCEINAPHSFYLYSGDLSQTKSLQVNAACPGEPEDCHTLVKIKDFSCAGNGYFGSLYFQEPGQQMSLRPVGLQDGKQYLVPIQLDKDATYRIGYRKATAAEVAPYDSAVVCMMYVGPSTPVVITCLEKVMEPEPGIIQKDTVVADDVICGWGIWEGIWFRPLATDGPYLQPTELTDALIAIPQPQAGQKYVIGYSPGKPYQADEQVICQAYPGPSTPIRVHSLIPIH